MRWNITQRAAALLLCTALLLLPASAAGLGNFIPDGPYAPFPDLVPDAWYFDDVCTARSLGIMEGKHGGRFDPMGILSLAEAATMAARVHAIYSGVEFVSGGEPWYQNSVDYGLAAGFLSQGEYQDYTQPATKADMAGMFAFALPLEEYQRANRVSAIPDVTAQTPYRDTIYLLYQAGVLTGNEGGAYNPAGQVTRAEAAAILNRAVLPERRRAPLLPPPSGTVVSSYDGASFQAALPDGWTLQPDPGDEVTQMIAVDKDGGNNVVIYRYDKSRYVGGSAWSMTLSFLNAQNAAEKSDPTWSLLRGLPGYAFSFSLAGSQGDQAPYQGWCVETGSAYFILLLGGSQAGLPLLYHLDFAL